MRLYVIRHGETDWNACFRLQGQTDIELNEKGRQAARATADGMKDIEIDLAITSPLKRARETAELVLGGRRVPVREDRRIQEIGFGSYEGIRTRNEKREIIEPLVYTFFKEPQSYEPPEGGERIQELIARTGAFLEELKGDESLRDKTVLVSTHGAASRALLLNIRKCPLEEFWQADVPKNCAVSIVDLADGEWRLTEQDVIFYENL